MRELSESVLPSGCIFKFDGVDYQQKYKHVDTVPEQMPQKFRKRQAIDYNEKPRRTVESRRARILLTH